MLISRGYHLLVGGRFVQAQRDRCAYATYTRTTNPQYPTSPLCLHISLQSFVVNGGTVATDVIHVNVEATRISVTDPH